MIDPKFLGSKKIAVIFKKQGDEYTHFIKGRNAQTLLWLINNGEEGVTANEISSWALRLGAYVFQLRHDYGLSIATIREPHDGGNHGRYVLQETIELVDVIYPSENS